MPDAALTPDAEHAVVEAEVLGQADAAKVETLEDGIARTSADGLHPGAVFEDIAKLRSQSFVIEEVDKKAVVAVGDDFFDGRSARTDDETAEAHGLSERP